MVDPKEHWAQKAEELKKDGKFEEAVEILTKVTEIEKEAKAEDFWYKKAIHSCELGEYEQAENELQKDLEVNQNYNSLFLMGKIMYGLKKYEESLEYYNKASEERNKQRLRNTQKIDQMKNVNRFEDAVKYSDKVHQEKNLDHDYWQHKAMTLFKLKKFNESASSLKIALETKQNNSKILYELAKAELHAGKKQYALDILEDVCNMNHDNRDKLRVDTDFDELSNEKQFRKIIGLI